MTPEINQRFLNLEWRTSCAFDALHDALLAELRRMARVTGQRTRVDRPRKADTPMARLFGCCRD